MLHLRPIATEVVLFFDGFGHAALLHWITVGWVHFVWFVHSNTSFPTIMVILMYSIQNCKMHQKIAIQKRPTSHPPAFVHEVPKLVLFRQLGKAQNVQNWASLVTLKQIQNDSHTHCIHRSSLHFLIGIVVFTLTMGYRVLSVFRYLYTVSFQFTPPTGGISNTHTYIAWYRSHPSFTVFPRVIAYCW